MLPDHKLAFKDDKCKGGKKSKQRITILLLTNMDASDRIKIITIGHSEKPRCLKNIPHSQLPVSYFHNRKAWMTSEIWQKILVNWDRKLTKQGRRVLLFADNVSSHKFKDNVALNSINIQYFPPNMTSILQPLDQGIIRSLKIGYRNELLKRFIIHFESGKKQSEFQFILLDCFYILASVWKNLPASIIQNSFNKAGFGIQTEEAVVEPSDIDPDLVYSVLNTADVQVQLQPIDYYLADENVYTEELTDTEIINHIQNATHKEEIEPDVAEKESISTSDAYSAIQTLKSYFAQASQSELYSDIQSLEAKFIENLYKTSAQYKITHFFISSNTIDEHPDEESPEKEAPTATFFSD